MRTLNQGLLAWLAMLSLASCSPAVTLTEDAYGTEKYQLPPLVTPGVSKSLSLTPGTDTWAYLSVSRGRFYTIGATTGSPSVWVTVYHADKTTAYATEGNLVSGLGFCATTDENVFLKLKLVTSTTSGSVTLNCGSTPLLTPGTWESDSIISGQSLWTAFSATAGTRYDFAMNNRSDGDGTKTAFTSTTLYHLDGTTFISVSSSTYTDPAVFVPSVSETILVKVYGSTSGTFAARIQPSAPPTVLTSGTWQDGTLVSGRTLWYSFAATAGTSYDFNMNNSRSGDSTKTGSTTATLYHADATTVIASSVTSAYATPTVFVPSVNETVLVKVSGSSGGGTFALRLRPSPPPTALTSDVWKDESILYGQTLWYSFAATAGTSYDFHMNNAYSGDRTAYTTATLYHADATTVIASSVNSAYAAPTVFVPAVNETVLVKVTASVGSGTFALRLRPSPPPTALTSDVWKDESILFGQTLWYSFAATAGTSYDFNMNNAYSSDRTKTAYTTATLYHADATTVIASSVSSAYAAPTVFVPAVNETVLVKVTASSVSGTFALRLRPSPPPTALTSEVWKDESILASQTLWYSFAATAGTSYDFNMNNAFNGDSTKTASTAATLYHADGTSAITSPVSSAFAIPKVFTLTVSETVLVKVTANSSAGTFALRIRPTPPPTVLTSGAWQDGSILNGQILWYSYAVTAGTSYDFNMNNTSSGDYTKTAETAATLYHSDGTSAITSPVSSAFATPTVFIPTVSETLLVKITASGAGTFALRIRPTPPPTVLTSGAWQDGSILNGQILWYSYAVTAGTSYDFNMNNVYYGDSTKTASTVATVYHADGITSIASVITSAFTSPTVFVPSTNETILVRISGSTAGTFAIRLQPTPPPVALTAGVWNDDSLTYTGQIKWYSFNVTAGVSYRVWSNNAYEGSGKTGYINVYVYRADKTTLYGSGFNSAYTTPRTFTAAATETVYLKVQGASSSYTGTFAVKFQ